MIRKHLSGLKSDSEAGLCHCLKCYHPADNIDTKRESA